MTGLVTFRVMCGYLSEKTRKIFLFKGILFLIFSQSSFFAYSEPMRDFAIESARSYGRGGTRFAIPHYWGAPYSNPAFLSTQSQLWGMRPLQLDLMYSMTFVESMQELFSGELSGTKVMEIVGDKFGRDFYGRFQALPLYTRISSVTVFPYVTNKFDGRMRNRPTVSLSVENDFAAGLGVGYGMQVAPNLHVGALVRSFSRSYIYGELDAADLLDFLPPVSKDFDDVLPVRDATYYAADLGLLWQPIGPNMNLALVIENVGYAAPQQEAEDNPPLIPARAGLGYWQSLNLFSDWKSEVSVDIDDLMNLQDQLWLRRTRMGFEFGSQFYKVPDLDLALLTGIYEGYFTVGFVLDMWIMRLEASNYAKELGDYAGQDDGRERRWAWSLSTSFTF